MTDFSPLLVPDLGQMAHLITLVKMEDFEAWLATQPPRARTSVAAQRFAAKAGEIAVIPGDNAEDWSVAIGVPETTGMWDLAAVAARLPSGTYRLAEPTLGLAALGWLLAHDRFDRYLTNADPVPLRVLLFSDPAIIPEILALADATALVRRLVNTPAADMGPTSLEAEGEALARRHDAILTVTHGDALERGFPMIHAVGRAAAREHAPRLIELEWGNPKNPRVAIIGKGVCFDSGGLDLKPASGMRLMKKDMGGAAHALGLAHLIMTARLPIRLHLLIPAVENAIAGNAFRPGDILMSRKGLSVEIDNTDAEGRLVLGDALTKACEDKPELIIDFATLTGAARVALGPDLPALFTNDDDLANALLLAGKAVEDPCWRMPLWQGYAEMLKSDIADCVNSAEGGFAGASTAALFLEKFVEKGTPWAHFDTFAWRPSAKAGRPKGGEALGLRATFAALKARYSAT
jgi:leucyl aminopeptidase